MSFRGGLLMHTIKDKEGKDIPRLKAQYGEADYKMLGNNAKDNAFSYMDSDLTS